MDKTPQACSEGGARARMQLRLTLGGATKYTNRRERGRNTIVEKEQRIAIQLDKSVFSVKKSPWETQTQIPMLLKRVRWSHYCINMTYNPRIQEFD